MDAEETVTYWRDRFAKQGDRLVGHAGETDAEFQKQTAAYGGALQRGLVYCKPGPAGRVLEIGCGWGRMRPFVMAVGGTYTGVDILPEHQRLARERWGAVAADSFHVGDPGNVCCALGERDFDAVVTVTVLQHIVDRRILNATVTEMMGSLSPTGRLVLIENVSVRANAGHIHFRKVADYRAMFPGVQLHYLETIEHKGQQHALMVGIR